MTISRTIRSLQLVSGGYLEPMIGYTAVKLRKIAGTRQADNCLTNQQHWIAILLLNLVMT